MGIETEDGIVGNMLAALDWPLMLVVALGIWASQKHGRPPLHNAFTFTFFGLAFFLTGVLGYTIRKNGGMPYLQSTTGVVWEQVRLAIVCAVAAVVCWRKSFQTRFV